MNVFELIGKVVVAIIVIGIVYLIARNVWNGIKEDRVIRALEREQREKEEKNQR